MEYFASLLNRLLTPPDKLHPIHPIHIFLRVLILGTPPGLKTNVRVHSCRESILRYKILGESHVRITKVGRVWTRATRAVAVPIWLILFVHSI